MAHNFITKRPHKKYIRPVRNISVKHMVPTESEATESVIEEKQEPDMTNEQLERIDSVLGAKKSGSRSRVKVEKKDKGLLERATVEGVTLLTEDGRTLLND